MPDSAPSCVLLADRHHGLTEGVRGLLETEFGTVVMVADEASLREAAARLHPEIAVVDLSLAPGRDLGWLTELHARCPEVRIVVLSVLDEASVRRAVLESGVDEFVLKRCIGTELLPAIARLRAG